MTEQAAAGTGGLPLVAVVASAGGVTALCLLVAALPATLPAAVLVALHLPESSHSLLAQILGRHATLPVAVAEDGLRLVPGQVLVAPPDTHLLVRAGRVVLGKGSPEHGHRPSLDALLRSVAREAGPRAVAVVMTGLLDDGAAGLEAVRRGGGACLVQDPDDAEFRSMPAAALRAVPAARSLSLRELPTAVVEAVGRVRALDRQDAGPGGGEEVVLQPVAPAVPALVAEAVTVEANLWVALRALEQQAELSRRLAADAAAGDRDWSSAHFARQAEQAEHSTEVVRAALRATVGERAAGEAGPAAAGAP